LGKGKWVFGNLLKTIKKIKKKTKA